MGFKITPENALNFAKGRVWIISSWPPSTSGGNKWKMIWFNVRWWISFVFLLLLFFPLLNGVYVFRNDSLVMIKAVTLSAANLQAIIKMAISRCQWKNLKSLHTDIDDFLKNATPKEREFIQFYVNKGSFFHLFFTVTTWLVCLALYIEPIVFNQPFPTDAFYPFNVDNIILHNVLYLQQALSIFIIASALIVDSQVAILIWFACARFAIIGERFEHIKNEDELKDCIQSHQNVLRYSDNVRKAVRFIAVGTITTTTIGVICGLLTVISKQPVSVKIRVAAIIGCAATELLIYSWPADDLIQISQVIGDKIYRSEWLEKSHKLRNMVQFVIHRTQKPVYISVPGIIPNLSLQYYTNFLSSTFSYFTTLRIVLAKEETSYEQ